MSKTKRKQLRREVKRDANRRTANFQRKAITAAKSSTAQQPPSKKQKPKASDTSTSTAPSKPAAKPHVQTSQRHDVPFGIYDNILLVGEGDFSFTRSLVVEHGCANVTATSFDSEEEVSAKYPSFEGVEKELKELVPPVPILHDIDATRLSSYKTLKASAEGAEDGEGGGEGWDTIAFLFPHTGGLSTDVNRQARANQALLVKFFESCIYELPAKPPRQPPPPFLKVGGKIIVTLFEGEAYDLWCIRNLARHAGLKVAESYKFDWGMYPGYRHMRTLGMVEGGGGWKGEEREARVYIFEKVGMTGGGGEKKMDKGKAKENRKRMGKEGSDSDSDAG